MGPARYLAPSPDIRSGVRFCEPLIVLRDLDHGSLAIFLRQRPPRPEFANFGSSQLSVSGYNRRNLGPMTALAYLGRDRIMAAEERCPRNEMEARDAILVVEDEVLVRMVIADQLRNAGFTVIEASDAQEALDVLRLNSGGVRLVLSDVRMPGAIDGGALARIVRSRYPMIKIVLTSGHVSEFSGLEHDGLFRKPYAETQVINHIKALLD
jgi:CheY-like chemotaxis protein